jgi:hypothetical protein
MARTSLPIFLLQVVLLLYCSLQHSKDSSAMLTNSSLNLAEIAVKWHIQHSMGQVMPVTLALPNLPFLLVCL